MIINKKTRQIICKNVVKRKTLFEKATGLMFKKDIDDETAYLFYFNKKSKISIHMFFVFFPIDIIFLDENFKVVEMAKLRPWQLYKSKENAKYFIEVKSGVARKKRIKIGDYFEIF